MDLARKIKKRKESEIQEYEIEFEEGGTESIINLTPDKTQNVEEMLEFEDLKKEEDELELIFKLKKRFALDTKTIDVLLYLSRGFSLDEATNRAGLCHKTFTRKIKQLLVA